MRGFPFRFVALLAGAAWAGSPLVQAQAPCQVLISVPEQRLAVVCDGQLLARFPISTSRFGTGDSFGSYQTPLGEFRVCDKIGEDLAPGAVIRHRSATGEVIPVNAPGRDPIVTRVLWLDGLEAQNRNAHSRGIYIHGTPDEKNLGRPMSWGCIRMRSRDVIELCQDIPVGATVSILPDKLPHLRRYDARREEEIAAAAAAAAASKPAPASLPAPAPAPAAVAPQMASAPEVSRPRPAETLAPIAEHFSSHESAAVSLRGSILMANLPESRPEESLKFATGVVARR